VVVNSLAVVASTFQPLENNKLKRFTIQMLYSPSVPDNIGAIQIFDEDKQIENFMASKRVFISQRIEDKSTKKDEGHSKDDNDEYVEDILQLKTNKLLRGIIDLERLFDQDVI